MSWRARGGEPSCREREEGQGRECGCRELPVVGPSSFFEVEIPDRPEKRAVEFMVRIGRMENMS